MAGVTNVTMSERVITILAVGWAIGSIALPARTLAQDRVGCPGLPDTASAEEHALCWADLHGTEACEGRCAARAAAWCADAALDDPRVADACLLSHVRAGQLDEARALAEYQSQPSALAARCRDQLTRVTTVRVATDPPGAAVLVDGERRGTAPVDIRLPSPWWRNDVAVSFGGQRVEVTDEELAGALDLNSCELTEVVVTDPRSGSPPSEPRSTPRDEPDMRSTSSDGPGLLPWIVAGAGAAVAVTGAVLLGVGLGDRATVEDPAEGARWSDGADEAYERGPALLTAGSVLLPVGLLLGTLGVVWALPAPSGEERLSVRVGPGSLQLAGGF